jgi:hypothetical protein
VATVGGPLQLRARLVWSRRSQDSPRYRSRGRRRCRCPVRAGPRPPGGALPARPRSSSSSALSLDRLLPHALATVLTASLTGFDRSPKPASSRRLKGSSPFDGSLRPDGPPDAGAARLSARRSAGRRRLPPSVARSSVTPNCPGRGNAPIEACRKADGVHDYPLTAVRLGWFFGLLSNAAV